MPNPFTAKHAGPRSVAIKPRPALDLKASPSGLRFKALKEAGYTPAELERIVTKDPTTWIAGLSPGARQTLARMKAQVRRAVDAWPDATPEERQALLNGLPPAVADEFLKEVPDADLCTDQDLIAEATGLAKAEQHVTEFWSRHRKSGLATKGLSAVPPLSLTSSRRFANEGKPRVRIKGGVRK